MKKFISKEEIYIHFDQRSVDQYSPEFAKNILSLFPTDTFQDGETVQKIIQAYYDIAINIFEKIIYNYSDMLFVNYLFAYHESSILLWLRVIKEENLYDQFEINESDLSLNRRVLKLALEQACDIDYKKYSTATKDLIDQYDKVIEDLLYIGTEIYHSAQFLAELRIIPNSLQIVIETNGQIHITRKNQIEPIFEKLFEIMNEDFKKGIMDNQGVEQLKGEIKKCFGIDYDFAAYQVVHIKQHLNPENWKFQTIEPGILNQNLINNGVSNVNAENFYAGLVLRKENKLKIRDAVYKVNSMERYFFRPILEISQNGNRRHLIGIEKWAESITVLATNNFQWNKAPEEWKNNECFKKYLEKKSDEHDTLLEDEVEKILKANNLPFFRNILSFGNGTAAKSVNVEGVGEIDFIWIDVNRKRIILADCKYNRARYDMISFSADYSNFKDTYEKKITNKVSWIEKNIDLVNDHFNQHYPNLNMSINKFKIMELFIINTPTFYMYAGRLNTVCFFNLEDFIKSNYKHPDIVVQFKDGYKTKMLIKTFPYLKP